MTGRRVTAVLVIVVLAAVAALFRFLSLQGFSNDHFLHLVAAQQIVLGEWPTKDFADPGMPLMYGASAAAQALLGRTLLSEGVLVAVAFGAAAALTAVTVLQLTSSLTLAVAATLFEVAIFPRSYGYPKLLLYAAGFAVYGWYLARPDGRRLAAMAGFAAVAFLFRHDHGVYLGGGACLAALLAPDTGLWRARVHRAAICAGTFGLFLLPYLLYVQAYEGLGAYLGTGIAFSTREAERQGRVWPSPFSATEPTQVVLLYLFHLLPLAAAATVVANCRDQAARILPIAAVGVLVNLSFIRDPLTTRLPDAVVPAVVLGAWLAARAWSAPRFRAIWIPATAVVALIAVSSVVVVGNTPGELDRMGLSGRWDELPRLVGERASELRERFSARQMPTRTVEALQPFFAYLDRCTMPTDRLLVTGFFPEVPYYARRPFAGGQSTFLEGYFGSEQNQRQVLDRLDRQVVPFVFVPSDGGFEELARGFPLVSGYVKSRFRELTVVPIDEERHMTIEVNRTLGARGIDPETGWPCFSERGR
ncbi:MAG: hypothetical protein ABL993_00435 [Vicinamibacterales bacterium]